MNRKPFWFFGLVTVALALAPMPAQSQFPEGQTPTPFEYVTCPTANNVQVIDPTTNTVVATVAVGISPRGVAVTPSRSKVYATNGGSNNVSAIDAGTNMVISTIPVGTEPNGVAVHPNGTRAYTANTVSGTVTVINTMTDTVVTTVPVGAGPLKLAVSPVGDNLWVVSPRINTIYVLNTATNTVVATRPFPFPVDVAFNPDGSLAAVTSPEVGVAIFDTSNFNIVGSVNIPGASEVRYRPDGSIYDVTSFSGTLFAVDTQTNTIQATADLGGAPRGVSFTADSSTLYVGIENPMAGNSVAIFDATTTTQIGSIPKGPPPLQLGTSNPWFCAPYNNVTPGDGSWTPGQQVIWAFPSGGCPQPTFTAPDRSTWDFVGPCTKTC